MLTETSAVWRVENTTFVHECRHLKAEEHRVPVVLIHRFSSLSGNSTCLTGLERNKEKSVMKWTCNVKMRILVYLVIKFGIFMIQTQMQIINRSNASFSSLDFFHFSYPMALFPISFLFSLFL